MAKSKKSKIGIKEGMKCYQKQGGGSHRFSNRIIKSGQRFWIYPEFIPESFKDIFKEVPSDVNAVVVETEQAQFTFERVKEAVIVPDKFEMIKAVDADGNTIKKGNSNMYNVVGEDGKALNPKPLRKGKATELLESLNV